LQLTWDAPTECPSELALRSLIERSATSALRSDIRTSVSVRRAAVSGYVADIRFAGAFDAARTMQDDSCHALSEASVWVIARALALDSAPERTRLVAKPVAVEPKRFEVGAAFILDSGALPGITGGLGVELAVDWGRLRFALEPRVFLPRGAAFAAGRASLGLAELRAATCLEAELGPLAVGPCLGVAPGISWGEAKGLSDGHSAVGGWLAVEALMVATFRLDERIGLRVEAGLARPLLAPEFTIGQATLHRTAGLLFRSALGLSLLF
jgi:hypothetical protein